MSQDDTGRRLIRQAQREGRLGTLSPGARKCLDEAISTFTYEVANEPPHGGFGPWVSCRSAPIKTHGFLDRAAYEGRCNAGYDAADARELGAFLAQLAEWLS